MSDLSESAQGRKEEGHRERGICDPGRAPSLAGVALASGLVMAAIRGHGATTTPHIHLLSELTGL